MVSDAVKGHVRAMNDRADLELAEAVVRVMKERNLKQEHVAERAGVSQNTISRLVRAVEKGRPLERLTPSTREKLLRYLATTDTDTQDRALVMARHIAANMLEELAHVIRSGSAEAPGEWMPPTLRRLLGVGSTGSDGDEPSREEMEAALGELEDRLDRSRRRGRAQ